MATDLQDIWKHLQRQLFPMLLEEAGELGEKDHLLVRVISLLPLGQWLERYGFWIFDIFDLRLGIRDGRFRTSQPVPPRQQVLRDSRTITSNP